MNIKDFNVGNIEDDKRVCMGEVTGRSIYYDIETDGTLNSSMYWEWRDADGLHREYMTDVQAGVVLTRLGYERQREDTN